MIKRKDLVEGMLVFSVESGYLVALGDDLLEHVTKSPGYTQHLVTYSAASPLFENAGEAVKHINSFVKPYGNKELQAIYREELVTKASFSVVGTAVDLLLDIAESKLSIFKAYEKQGCNSRLYILNLHRDIKELVSLSVNSEVSRDIFMTILEQAEGNYGAIVEAFLDTDEFVEGLLKRGEHVTIKECVREMLWETIQEYVKHFCIYEVVDGLDIARVNKQEN